MVEVLVDARGRRDGAVEGRTAGQAPEVDGSTTLVGAGRRRPRGRRPRRGPGSSAARASTSSPSSLEVVRPAPRRRVAVLGVTAPAVSAWNLANYLTVLRLLLVPVFLVLLLVDDGQDPAVALGRRGGLPARGLDRPHRRADRPQPRPRHQLRQDGRPDRRQGPHRRRVRRPVGPRRAARGGSRCWCSGASSASRCCASSSSATASCRPATAASSRRSCRRRRIVMYVLPLTGLLGLAAGVGDGAGRRRHGRDGRSTTSCARCTLRRTSERDGHEARAQRPRRRDARERAALGGRRRRRRAAARRHRQRQRRLARRAARRRRRAGRALLDGRRRRRADRRRGAAGRSRTPRSSLVTGGLGPTSDDVTRDAVAAVAGVPLVRSPELEQALRERFAAYRYEMPETVLRAGRRAGRRPPLDNPVGTRPGPAHRGRRRAGLRAARPAARAGRRRDRRRAGRGRRRAAAPSALTRTLHCAGRGESEVAEVVERTITVPPGVDLAYLAGGAVVRVRLTTVAATEADADAVLAPLVDALVERARRHGLRPRRRHPARRSSCAA